MEKVKYTIAYYYTEDFEEIQSPSLYTEEQRVEWVLSQIALGVKEEEIKYFDTEE